METLPVSSDGPAPTTSTTAARPSLGLWSTLIGFVVAVAVAGYAWKGSPGLKPAAAQSAAAGDAEMQAARVQIEAMVGKLVDRLKAQPDDATGWLMLGRSYTVLDRIDDALPAYAKAIALRPTDATSLADYADALASKAGGRATPEADALVARALAANPSHLKALALAGTFAFERSDYATAVRHWEKMAQVLPPDSPDAPRLQASLDEARRRGGLPAAAMPKSTLTATGPTISGTVTLAPALAAKANPNDAVFVYARAVQGPRMPLAVLRAQVKDLPLAYTLDDSMGPMPTAKLSSAPQVVVSARISKSGNAIAQAGDLLGEAAAPVAPGASGVAITIGSIVGQ